MLKRLILHPFAFAIFPILALLAHNIAEVNPRVALRSIIISLSATIILILIVALISRSWQRAAIVTTFILILFFSYGQVYELLQKTPIFGFSLGRHRYLAIIFSLILTIGLWWIFRKLKDLNTTTQALNSLGVLLLVFPVFLIANHTIRTSISEQRMVDDSAATNSSVPSVSRNLPDVYYIILDTYTRGDALLNDFGFDNSTFLDNLQSMGFYVAECSRSNYPLTERSMVSELNMSYLPEIRADVASGGLNIDDIWILIKQSQVRKQLEALGYKTVAFESGYEWSRLSDADVYLQYTGAPYEMQVLQPFEAMLIRTTALLIWSDATYKSLPEYTHTPFAGTNFPFEDHINRQLFILDELPRLASFPGPKFVFVHILIPHIPFVFLPDGEITSDRGFYSGDKTEPTDEAHLIQGYVNQIQFINSRMTDILQTLVTQSDIPPIIVIHGDHGLRNDNRSLIFNAYYLPGNGDVSLYPTITPVNSFRLIFDTYFGTHYGLLPDMSYDQTEQPIPETSPECIQK
jgi:hypothetical protein